MARIITVTPNPVRDYAVDADAVEANRKIRCKNTETHAAKTRKRIRVAAGSMSRAQQAVLGQRPSPSSLLAVLPAKP